MLSDLRAADDALGRGDRARALDALLEAWRAAPAMTGRLRVPRLDLEMGGASLRLARGEAGGLSLTVHCDARFWMHSFEETVRGVPWADLARVDVTWDAPPAALDRLRPVLVHPNVAWPAVGS